MSNLESKQKKTKHTAPSKKGNLYSLGLVVCINILLSVVLITSVLGATICGVVLNKDFSDSGDVVADMKNVVRSESEDVQYFLVAGTDESDRLTDIMMVVCFDLKANTANILQIPRDTFIGIDVPTKKMNAVYGQAPREQGQTNINVLLRRINDYFGLPIDHYITVTLSAFRDIVDAVGGVDVYVNDTIYNAFNSKREYFTFEKGMNHFDGSKAEAYVRHRKSYVMGDLGRVRAQRNFYAAFIEKCLNMSYSQMASVATSIYDQISTDMKLVDILAFAELAQAIPMEKIKFHAVPGQTGMFSVNGGQVLSYFSIHKTEYVELINKTFMPYSKGIAVDQIKIQELHTQYEGTYIEDKDSIKDYLGNE